MKRRLMPYLLLSPFFILMFFFCIGILNGILQSFGYIPAFDMKTLTLQYYAEALKNESLLRSVGYSLWIALASSLLAVVLGVLLCFGIVSARQPKSVLVSAVRIPILIPHMIVALFVIGIFSQTGLLARVLFHLGLVSSPEGFPALLYDPNGIGVILAYLWKEIPFVCYFVMTLMANITCSLEEAAMTLGASRIKSFWNITLPLCRPVIRNAFFIIFAFSFGAYELPFLLGATRPKALPVQAYIEYTHPDLTHRPFAMVLNAMIIVVCLLAGVLYYQGMDKGDRYE